MRLLHGVRWWATLVLVLALCACSKTAENFIESAKSHQAKGRDREAAIEFKNALAVEPDNAEANFLLGGLLIKVGNPADAQLALRSALKLGRPPGDVLPVLAEALLETEKYADVIELLKGKLDLDRGVMAKIAVLRGRAYLGQGSLLDARTQFQLAIKDLPSEAKLGLARLSLAGGDRPGAQRQVDEVIASNPKHADAWVARSEFLRGDGHLEDALVALRKASQIDPGHVVAMLTEAIVLITRGDLEQGRKLIERVTGIAPLKPMLEFARALLAFKELRFDESRAALQRLLEVVPTHAPAILLAGSLSFSTEQYELAQNSYVAYLTTDPGNLYARKMLAATLIAKGQARIAASVLDPVLEKSQDPELLAMAGRAYLMTGRAPQAVDLLQKAVDLAPDNAYLLTSLGLTQLVAGQRARAIVSFESAITRRPKNTRPDHALAMMLLADGQIDRAEKVVANLEGRLADSPETTTLRGAVSLARKNNTAARASFEKALAIKPSYVPAAEALADMDRREGKPEALRSRMESILARDAQNLQALLVLASLDMQQGKGEQGVARVRKILTTHPRSLQALLMLAELQLSTGKPQEAITSARRATEEHPWDTRAVGLLADAQLASGDLQSGIATLTRLADMRPRQADPQVRIAAAQIKAEDPRGAISRLQGVLRMDPGNLRAQVMLAEVFAHQKRFDEALVLAHALQKNRPKSAAGFRLEGDILLATGGSAKAVFAYQSADSRQPSGELRVKVHRAQALVSSQIPSTKPLEDWLARNPGDNEVRLYLGEILNQAERHRDAVAQYLELLKRLPDDYRVLNNLAWAMQQAGDPGALQYAEMADKLQPEDPRVLDTLGAILLAQGRGSDSVQVLLRAVAKAPDSTEIRLHLAEALVKVGDTGRARKELMALLASAKAPKESQAAKALLARLGP